MLIGCTDTVTHQLRDVAQAVGEEARKREQAFYELLHAELDQITDRKWQTVSSPGYTISMGPKAEAAFESYKKWADDLKGWLEQHKG
jgi:hypothetical protein